MSEALLATTPTAFQSRVLQFRRHCNIFNGGGRGSGKSVSLTMDTIDHCNELGPVASPLILRESWSGLQELQFKMFLTARIAFGSGVAQNKSEGTIRIPNGATIHFRNVGDPDSFAAAQGKTYTMMGIDEMGNYPLQAITFVNLLRSNLRPPKGYNAHIHITANPMGRAHTHCLRNFVQRGEAWKPYVHPDDGSYWINCYSDLTDNPTIDTEAYRRQLQAATAGNPALQEAWISGSWHTKGGGLMFDMFDPATHIKEPPPPHYLRHTIGLDWGTASPAVGVLLGELRSPWGTFIPGDLFVVDMFDTCIAPGNYHQGDGSPASVVAAMVKSRLLEPYGLPPSTEVHIDNARGLGDETVVSIFQEQGLSSSLPVRGKNRVGGWARIRNLLDGAIHGDSHGLWLSPRCGHLIDTIGIAPRDDLRPEDLSRHFNEDHAIDALNYAVSVAAGGPRVSQSQVIGAW